MIKVILLKKLTLKKPPSQKKFQTWVDQVTKTIPEKIPKNCREIGIAIIDKKTSAALNKTYSHKIGATNVLSFTYQAIPGIDSETLGDLAICAELVERELQWAHLTVHGVLHLLGYDHIEENDANIMEALEITILDKLGFENPYKTV